MNNPVPVYAAPGPVPLIFVDVGELGEPHLHKAHIRQRVRGRGKYQYLVWKDVAYKPREIYLGKMAVQNALRRKYRRTQRGGAYAH